MLCGAFTSESKPSDIYTFIFAGVWDVLIEVVAALQHAEGSVRRQWVVDAVEISCVSSYPSTVGTRHQIPLMLND